MALPIGPVIGAVGSVIGGLLGGETKQKGRSRSTSRSSSTSRTHNNVRLGQMVAAAERHGFNPLTFLRAGGLAAFTDTTTTGTQFSKSFSKNRGNSQSSAPLGAGIAQAAQIIGGAVDNGPSPQSGATRDAWAAGPTGARAEMDLINKQLAQVPPGALGDQPQHRSSQVYTKQKPALAAENYDGSPVLPKMGEPEATNPFGFESGILIDPKVPNPGERYQGEIAENVFDARTAFKDWKYNNGDVEIVKLMDQADKANMSDQYIKGTYWPAKAAALGYMVGNYWDPMAIKLVQPPVVSWQDDAPMAINHYKKPEFVDGGPKW